MTSASVVATGPASEGHRWLAPYGMGGIALVAVAWTLSWSHLRPWGDYSFFPLWLGYIVTVDALVRPRLGWSLLGAGVGFPCSNTVELCRRRRDRWPEAPVGTSRCGLSLVTPGGTPALH